MLDKLTQTSDFFNCRMWTCVWRILARVSTSEMREKQRANLSHFARCFLQASEEFRAAEFVADVLTTCSQNVAIME